MKTSNTRNRQVVDEFVQSHSLPEDKMQQMLALADAQSNQKSHDARLKLAGMAATLVLAFGLWFMWPSLPLPTAIADEVAKNHLNLKPMEISSTDFSVVASYFSKLDFRPAASVVLQGKGWQLTGGRYCSLLGNPAAQFRYQLDASEQSHTLYQAPYDPMAYASLPVLEDGAAPLRASMRGIEVAIWVEKGILFALTDPPANWP